MGAGAIDKLPKGIKKDPEAVAETITNNMRKVIIDERAMNPKYYDRMSELLDALIEERRKGALDYKEYLERAARPSRSSSARASPTPQYPDWADNGAKRALVDFGFPSERPRHRGRPRGHGTPSRTHWVGNPMKEKKVKRALAGVLPDGFDRLDELFDLVKARDEYR